jgi:hypothetical protein
MTTNTYKSFFKLLVASLLLVLQLNAQSVTSGLTGLVDDATGAPVAGAEVTAIHTPTSTTYHATTRSDGRYDFRGLIVGGPYTITASSPNYTSADRSDVTTQLGEVIDVNFVVQKSDVVKLEKLVVSGSSNDLDSSSNGAGGVIDANEINSKPTTARRLNDIISASPLVTLRSTSGDREEASISAVGMNNRYNSIMIDGARVNDQFGLYSMGTFSFFNPLSLDTVDQISVQLSPYDVRYSGFTGAAINAVTKSGTNTFHGSSYYLFSGDRLGSYRLQGPNSAPGTTYGITPKLQAETYGFTFGGPVIPNKVFFFSNYEKFGRLTPPSSTGLYPNSADLNTIKTRFAAINAASGNKADWGNWTDSAVNKAQDQKKLMKLDWNITDNQRLSVRYSETNGEVPLFGSYTSTSYTSILGTIRGGGTTALTSHFYSQTRNEKVYAAQLISQWTSNFKTEAKYSKTKEVQLTPTNAVLPEIHIFGVSGVDYANNSITNGVVIAGTEQYRQGNIIKVSTDNYSLAGDYFLGNTTVTAGFDREKSNFYNLFRAGSYGRFDFASVNDFLTDKISGFSRAFYVQGTPQADVSDFATTGLFAQAKIDVSTQLNFVAGLRYDYISSGTRPPFNALFLSQFGARNDGTVDGTNSTSPRFGFNYAVDKDRNTQVRGGIGHIEGRAPWVWFSNSYSQPGVGRFATNTAPAGLVSYLTTDFNPASPIGSAPSITPGGRYEVDYTDDKIKLPAVWRANLAVDHKLTAIDSILSMEIVATKDDQALYMVNDNLKPTTIGADGRQRFAGNVGTAANALHPDFINVYHTKNVSVGSSTYWTISLERRLKDGWTMSAAYSNGHAKDAMANGGTTAGGIWGPHATFNQNTVEKATSEFQTKNRVQLQVSKKISIVKNWPMTIALYYEGHSGNPYSFIYSNDLNGDGQTSDLVAVPSSSSDPRFDFSKMAQSDVDGYFQLLASTGLKKYAGGYAPRNAFEQPWINRLDLHVSQVIPVYKPFELEVFADFTNFGYFLNKSLFNYYQRASGGGNDTDWYRYIGTASYGTDGRIVPGYTNTTVVSGSAFTIDNLQSRWKVQVGAKLKF